MADYPAIFVRPTSLIAEVSFGTAIIEAALDAPPPLLISAIVEPIGKVPEGELIKLVDGAWLALLGALHKDPSLRFRLSSRECEELIAAMYDAAGFKVTLTPRSGDGGRDVIAIKDGFASIRIIEQVKAFGEGRVVTANDVRALLGVLSSDLNATKGVVTTTASFAPRISEDRSIAPFVPYRLQLVDGRELMTRLRSLRRAE